MLEYTRRSGAAPSSAWRLLARPGSWSRWAPHLRGAWGLGSPEVREGRRGVVRVAGFLPVPVRITAKRAGRCWAWRAGPYEMEHRVDPATGGCELAISVKAAAPLERVFALTYGRAIPPLLGRLAEQGEALEREGAGSPA